MTWSRVDMTQGSPPAYAPSPTAQEGAGTRGRPPPPANVASSTPQAFPESHPTQAIPAGPVADRAKVEEAVDVVKRAARLFNRRVDFEIDQDTERIIIKVMDKETDKVIKEIPPGEVLRFIKRFHEALGLLMDEHR